MKTLLDYIKETKGSPVNDYWLDNEKPVMTKGGLQAIVTEIDMSVVPNIIKGKVKIKDDLYDFEWQEDGTCVKACDASGNPTKPEEMHNLVQAV